MRDGSNYPLVLSFAQSRLLAALTVAEGIPVVVPSNELAATLGIVVTSLGVTVSRFNAAVAEQVPRPCLRLVISERGSGYKLNITRIIHC